MLGDEGMLGTLGWVDIRVTQPGENGKLPEFTFHIQFLRYDVV